MGGMKRQVLEKEASHTRTTTLGEIARQAIGIFCWCNRCGHNAEVPSERFIGELGADFPVPEIGTRLKCSNCASKDVATRPNWPGLGPVTSHGASRTSHRGSSRRDEASRHD